MRYLIDQANEYGLRQIIEQAMSKDEVHGIIIDIHPFWLWLTGYSQKSLHFPFDFEYLYYLLRRGYNNCHPTPYWSTTSDIIGTTLQGNAGKIWNEFFEKKSKLIAKILLRPGAKPIEINYEGRLSIVQENRPVPRFSSSKSMCRPVEGGVSIGHMQDNPGTLGGIVVDSQGRYYGLTCAHVISGLGFDVDQPSRLDNSSYSSIGTCVLSKLPSYNNGVRCNIYNSGVLNEMDVALIELNSTIQCNFSMVGVGKIDGHTPGNQMHPNLLIDYTGRTSGFQSLSLGGIGVIQEITDHNGGKYCMNHLIEIKRPTMVSLALNRPVHGGDSGAWIVTQGASGTEWCGMIVAEERQTGYAIGADAILSYLNNNGFTGLKCC